MEGELVRVFRENYEGNEDSLQKSLLEIKKLGCRQVQAVKLLLNELGITLNDADKIVLTSKAWEKEKTGTLKLRDNLEKGLSDF